MQGLETNKQSYGHLTFDKGDKNMHDGEDKPIQQSCWENWISTYRAVKLDPDPVPCRKNNSMWTKKPKRKNWNAETAARKLS